MPLYYYQKEHKTGSKLNFYVWKHTRSGMKDIGTFSVNTASYYGARPEVSRFIAKKEGYQLTDKGYHIKRKDVTIKSL